MMYTKEEESVVTLTGGSPWGFTIRTQAGNGYTRGRVVVAKVVQGGKADSSGSIHVGDEIIAVNGFEFDSEQQATEYVRSANKELILKVKRGQDKRRMNIRLASELPNYYATALESPVEKSLYREYNTYTNMFSNNVNNKRSSKEYEKDLSYKVSSDTANAIIDYQSDHLGKSIRLTRSTTDLPDHLNISRDQPLKDNISRSPPRKSYNPPPSPDKVQRVRIRSTNVTSPDHYKCSPGSDKSSPTMDENQKHSESRSPTPGYSGNIQKPFGSSVMEDLNRTWPSAASSDVSRQEIRLASHKSFSVSAAKSHFEQMSQSSELPHEIDRRQKPSSSSSLAPKPPSRNSSFRSSRLPSSPVFQDSGSTKTTSETKATPNRQNSFSDKSRYLAYEKDVDPVPVRNGSSSEDLDKPLPPRRFSQSKVLTSFRSSKKPAYQASPTGGASTVHEHKVEQLERSPEIVYHHGRTQSLPSSKLVAMHLSSKSWVADEEKKSLGSKSQEFSRNEYLPRSSSFSRARVVETSSVKSVHRDDSKSSTVTKTKSTTRNYRSEFQPGVIQALRTGAISSETKNKLNVELRSKSTPYLKQESSNERQDIKTELFKPEQSKTDVKKADLSIPVLKENSIMQRLLLESQPQGESNARSKVAAMKEEISQRTDNAKPASKATTVVKTESVAPIQQQQRSINVAHNKEVEENPKFKDPILTPEDVNKKQSKKEDETAVEESQRPPQTMMNNSKNDKQSAAKVDRYLDKLLGKLDSPPVNRRPFPTVVPEKIDSPSLVKDDVFLEPMSNGTGLTTNGESETQLVENNVEGSESAPDNPTSGLVISKNERNREIDSPSPEIIVKSDDPDVVVESILKDDNDNISESIVPEKTERRVNDGMKKTIELKDCNSQLLSPKDKPLKVIHSRENSASSLLEETLESAKTIASIYSVELSTRCVDGEDSLSTASEMRRYSLAKRVVRRKPKTEDESSFNKKPEAGDQLNQSLSTPEKVQSSFIDSGTPIDENEAEREDESGNRSTGSLSSSGSRPSSGIISPKLEALEEQKELLVSSMKKKVELLKEQESEINDEMKQNDDLGKRVAQDVKEKTSGTEFSKFELFVGELNNIIGLLLSLTQRMHRYEVMLQDIDLAEENGRDKRVRRIIV